MSEPRINATLSSQADLLSETPQRALIINASSATAGWYRDIPNDFSWRDVFGNGSPLTKAIDAFKRVNSVTPLDVISLTPSTGNATSTVTITGGAISASTIVISIGSRKYNTYKIPIPAGTVQDDIAAAISAVVAADSSCVASATAAANIVTFTIKIPGIQGVETPITLSGLPENVSATLSIFTGGIGFPDIDGAFDVVGDTRYQTVTGPISWGTKYLTDFLDNRFNTDNEILDGVAIISSSTDLQTAIAQVDAINSQSLVYFWNKQFAIPNEYFGSAVFDLDCAISAYFAGVRALRRTPGANLSGVIVNNQPNDQIGGPSIAGIPYANTPFPDLVLIDRDKLPSLSEETALNAAGGSVFSNNKGFTSVVANRVLTTYKKDAVGVEDKTFQFLNTVDIASEVRELFFNAFKREYSQTRLTLGHLIANTAMTNANQIRAFTVLIYRDLGEEEFVLVQTDQNLINEFKDNLDVSIEDVQQGRVRVSMRIKPVSQLRTIDMPIEVVFKTL